MVKTNEKMCVKSLAQGTSLAAQWLRLQAPNAGDPCSIPGQETKIPHAAMEILCAATKIRCSQISKYINKF